MKERERREGGSKDSNNHAGSMQGPKDTISNQDIVPEAWFQMQTMSSYKSGGYQTPGSLWWSQRCALCIGHATNHIPFYKHSSLLVLGRQLTFSLVCCLERIHLKRTIKDVFCQMEWCSHFYLWRLSKKHVGLVPNSSA